MRLTRLGPALLAALAALLLAGALAPAQARAESPPTAWSQAGSITTVLHPGWNMVGWVGPATPTSELFKLLPQLRRVSAWDAGAGSYQRAFRGRYAQLPSLTPGMGLWLHVTGEAPVPWTRPAISDGSVLRLQRGLNLVGVIADGAVGRPGEEVGGAWRWDPVLQQYEPYSFGDESLRQGDALWIEASAPVNWWQPGNAEPPFVFLGDVPTEDKQAILGEYRNVRRFFAEHFAVATRSTRYRTRPIYVAAGRLPVRLCGWTHQGLDITLLRCLGPPASTTTSAIADRDSRKGAVVVNPRSTGWWKAARVRPHDREAAGADQAAEQHGDRRQADLVAALATSR